MRFVVEAMNENMEGENEAERCRVFHTNTVDGFDSFLQGS